MRTLGERYRAEGRTVGLVTTSYLSDATPAAFAAHAASRFDRASIRTAYLAPGGPDPLLGGGLDLPRSMLEAAGFVVVEDAAGLAAATTSGVARLAGVFGLYLPYEFDGLGPYPSLAGTTCAALDVAGRNARASFLLIEGGRIDRACHANDLARCIGEVVGFERAVAAAVEWAVGRDDALIIVAADHETGGLEVPEDRGLWRWPVVRWSTTGHTAVPITVWAWGRWADRALGVEHLTDVHDGLADPAFPRPRITSMVRAKDGLALTWLAISGRVYQVQCSASAA